jgi:WD40 repeat protein
MAQRFSDLDIVIKWSGATDLRLDTFLNRVFRPTKSTLSKQYNLNYVFTGGHDPDLKIWNRRDGTLYKKLSGHTGIIARIVNISEGKVASGSHDRTIRVWNIHKGECLHVLTNPSEVCGLTVMSPNILVCGLCTGKNFVSVWNVSENKNLVDLQDHSNTIWTTLRLTPSLVVSGSADGKVNIWNIDTKTLVQSVRKHKDWVVDLCALSESSFVSCDTSNNIFLWEFKENKLESTGELQGHIKEVSNVAKLDDKTLVSCSSDKTVRIWNLVARQCTRTITCDAQAKGLSVIDKNVIACGVGPNVLLFDLSSTKQEPIMKIRTHKEHGNYAVL